jgi:hypothetical protein
LSELLNLQAHLLQFDCQAETAIHLNAAAGGQIRGALWSALSKMVCPDPAARANPDHQQHCPLCRLMHLETVSARGINPARPFAIRPPLNPRIEQAQILEVGHCFNFQIVLFGDAAGYIPYIVQTVYRVGQLGIGTGRGRFRLLSVKETNPFTGSTISLYTTGASLQPATQPILSAHIEAATQQLITDRIALHFLTPAQLTQDGHTLTSPQLETIIARLLERCQSLEAIYSDHKMSHEVWRERHLTLSAAARNISIERDDTRWVDVWSRSGRTGHMDNIGGLVGTVIFKGDIAKLRFWLIYGQVLHVGKNAVKGNGWYEMLNH